jgi:hypothetical protein
MASTASSYDLFLSDNSADQEVVEHIAHGLRGEGPEPSDLLTKKELEMKAQTYSACGRKCRGKFFAGI